MLRISLRPEVSKRYTKVSTRCNYALIDLKIDWRLDLSRNMRSSGGPIHASVPIHAHPQFSQRFIIFHRKDVYHIIDNYQIDHIH